MALTDEQWQYIQQAIWNGEQSGGNYQEYNSTSGAAGAYQFMPYTWQEKANKYGYSEYANIPNASYAPPDVQDSVARAWADDLYNEFGDVRYVLDAWLGGEGAARQHKAQGYIPDNGGDGNITYADYVERALGDGELPLPQEQTLDMSVITTNNPDQSVTNTDNLRPEAIYGANTLGYYMTSTYGQPLLISGGAEIGYHAKSSTGHGHEDGWKIDVANDGIAGGTAEGQAFKAFCNQQGWSANWESDHWDIDFSGQDSRDPQRGGFTGNFFGETFSSMPDANGYDYINQMINTNHDEYQYFLNNAYKSNDVATPSFWDKLSTGFMDGLTTTGAAYVAQSLWGNLFHSSNHFGTPTSLTQEDIDYVKNALPDDPEAQRFALLNGRDSEEVKWLVNQKLVDKKRQEEIAKYNEGCIFTIANTGRFVGGMIDPTMLIPVGTAFNGLKITARLGKAIYNVPKVARIANKAAKMGIVNKSRQAINSIPAKAVGTTLSTATSNAVAVTVDNKLKEEFGGVELTRKEYAWDAANAFIAGEILGGALGVYRAYRSGKKALKDLNIKSVEEVADDTETKAIYSAADLEVKRNETIGEALKLHDVEYGNTIKSKYYRKLEKNGRIVAAKFDDVRRLVSKASGIEIPKSAKAFYVPNEDYTILIKDNIKPVEIDNVLAHEFGVHAGLPKLVGGKQWNTLSDEISRLANKDGHIFNKARAEADSYDPEEILAYAVEHKLLPDGFVSNVKGMINRAFKREGFSTKITSNDVKTLLEQQLDASREAQTQLHFNADGSTAFAGIRFSKNNLVNPQLFGDFITLEQNITKDTQLGVPSAFKMVTKLLEQGSAGVGNNSSSNTIRKYINKLVDDPRGRGLGYVDTISAETNKLRLQQQLYEPYLHYADKRQSWCLANKQMGRSAHMAFDKLAFLAFNSKYANNKANVPMDLPKEAIEAADLLKALRDKQIELGKRSAIDVGSTARNMVEKDWKIVDDELWRVVDNDMRMDYLHNFKSEEEARDFLTKYYKTFAKRDIIKAKIEREIDKKNKKIQEANDKIAEGSTRKQKELLKKNVTDEDIDKWLDIHVPNAVGFAIKGNYDTTIKQNIGHLGTLSSFKERVPIDTTGVLKMPNGLEFSFDNNLRNFDLDSIIQKNINRFAGEASVMNVFGSQKNLENFLKKAKQELTLAYETGHINKSKADYEYRVIEDMVYELRGMRPNAEAMSRLGALAQIFRKLAYAKNGANMGFAQLGELGGTISYGGIAQLAHVFKPLGNIIDNARWGKITTDTLNQMEQHMFGSNIESQIFTVNWGDRVVRDALTDRKDIISKGLRATSDMVSNLGKVTSAINMLPKMTDSMLRGMRTQTIMDSIKWANGNKMPNLRNPFTKAKLKASHISTKEAERIRENINKCVQWEDGKVTSFDVAKWQQEDPVSFAQWYGMIQTQAERAIIAGNRIGNRNIFKDHDQFTQMLFQFKDYSLRAINAGTMRAMTAKDLDDAMATALSMITNTAAYAIKAGATYAALKAVGADEKAKEYYDRMFNQNNLLRAAAFRSTIIGSPLSIPNDFLEATGLVDTSIRTTVNRSNYGQPQNFGDAVGNAIAQAPALQQAQAPFDVLRFFNNMSNDEANKRDFKKAIQALPVPNLIPFAAFVTHFVDQSDYPEKRPEK